MRQGEQNPLARGRGDALGTPIGCARKQYFGGMRTSSLEARCGAGE